MADSRGGGEINFVAILGTEMNARMDAQKARCFPCSGDHNKCQASMAFTGHCAQIRQVLDNFFGMSVQLPLCLCDFAQKTKNKKKQCLCKAYIACICFMTEPLSRQQVVAHLGFRQFRRSFYNYMPESEIKYTKDTFG